MQVQGRTLLAHAAARLLDAVDEVDRTLLDELVVVVPVGHEAEALELLTVVVPAPSRTVVRAVAGGMTRQASVAAGLARLGTDVVLVHDAARAFAPAGLVAAVAAAIAGDVVAVVPGMPVVDTVKRVEPTEDGLPMVRETLPRAELVTVQTPQGFDAALLRRVHAGAAATNHGAGDDAMLVEAAGGRVHVVPGDPDAFKVTLPADLVLAAAVLARHDALARGEA